MTPTPEEVRAAGARKRARKAEEERAVTADEVRAAGQRRRLKDITTGEARPISGLQMWRAKQMEKYGPAMASFAAPIGKAALGLTELTSGPEQVEVGRRAQARVEAMAQQASPATRGIMGTAGEVGLLAGPGMAGLKTAQLAGKAAPLLTRGPTRSWLTPAASEAAAIGGAKAAYTPGTPLERARAGTQEAMMAATGHALGRGLEKALRGIQRSPEAESLIRRGTELTPGQASAGRLAPFLESRFTYVPGLAGPTSALQKKSLETWNKMLLKEAVAAGRGARPSKVTRPGYGGVKQAEKELGKAYNTLYKRVEDPDDLKELYRTAGDIHSTVMQDAKAHLVGEDINKVLQDVAWQEGNLRKNLSPAAVQQFRKGLKDSFGEAAKENPDSAKTAIYRRALEMWERALDDISPGFIDDLKGIDRGYAQVKAFEEASNVTPAYLRGVWSPQELITATKGKRELLEQALYEGKETIRDLLGKENIFGQLLVGGGGLGILGLASPATAAGVAGSALAIGQTALKEPMRRTMLGQTEWQRMLSPTERRAQQLRSYLGRGLAAGTGEY